MTKPSWSILLKGIKSSFSCNQFIVCRNLSRYRNSIVFKLHSAVIILKFANTRKKFPLDNNMHFIFMYHKILISFRYCIYHIILLYYYYTIQIKYFLILQTWIWLFFSTEIISIIRLEFQVDQQSSPRIVVVCSS